MEITVRLKHYGNDIVMIQRKYRWFFFFPAWRDWRPLNNDLVEHDQKIVDTCNKLEKLLKEREDLKIWFKEQKKRFNGGILTEPFPLKVDSKDFFFKKYPVLLPIDEKWKKLLNAHVLGERPEGIRGKMGIPERKESMKSVFIPSELSQFKATLETSDAFDHVVVLKDNENKDSNKQNSPRKKRPGESDQEHRERLRKMDAGEE